MGETIYGALQQIGYSHPLHPVLVHLPVGLVVAVFLFSLAAMFLRQSPLAQTARHCTLLALLTAPFAAAAGLMDWLHFYGGAWIAPFVVKMVLAVLLIAALAVAAYKGMQKEVPVKRLIPVYLFSLAMVGGLGFFGGEIVYGPRAAPEFRPQEAPPDQARGQGTDSHVSAPRPEPSKNDGQPDQGRTGDPPPSPDPAAVEAGRQLFSQKCSFCHHTDRTDTKIGPGLQGLFARERLPVSGWPATEESVRRQIRTPFDSMPPFPDLPPESVGAIVSYLKTL